MDAMTDPRWPVALLSGFLGSGKTTLVRALLARNGMADTLVVVNEFGAIGIDHALIEAVHDDVVLLRGGCLCCGVRQDLARTLRDVHLRRVHGEMPPFGRVIVEASGLADPGPVVATITSHPLVSDAYRLRSVTTLVDAEHGERQLALHEVGWRQVASADRLLISKADRVAAGSVAALLRRLATINPLAAIGRSRFGDADAAPLFAPATPIRRTRLQAASVADHVGGYASHVLSESRGLAWPKLQRWIAGLMAVCGERLLRLKGVVAIIGQDCPVVLHAVGQSFYPVETLPAWRGAAVSTLVLIVTGPVPPDLQDTFSACAE